MIDKELAKHISPKPRPHEQALALQESISASRFNGRRIGIVRLRIRAFARGFNTEHDRFGATGSDQVIDLLRASFEFSLIHGSSRRGLFRLDTLFKSGELVVHGVVLFQLGKFQLHIVGIKFPSGFRLSFHPLDTVFDLIE